jgi:TatD DNase family protein
MNRLPLFDTHAHLDTEDFDADRDELIAQIGKSMLGFIDPGCDIPSCEAAVALAHKYPFVFAAVGLHPEDIGHCQFSDLKRVEEMTKDPRVVAIGEIGLDYYNDEESPHDLQKKYLCAQFDLARRTGLPVIIHDRDAHEDMLDLVKTEGKEVSGVMHCYSGDWDMAKELLDLGWYFGFGGTSTFKHDHGVRDILTKMPMDRILFETDSPYMAPVPYRGKRNCPLYVEKVAELAASLKNISPLEMMQNATKNSKNLFFRLKID